ncbi:hypothetical protein ACVWY5_003047 [Bradyrhizobium sp. USDA 3256]
MPSGLFTPDWTRSQSAKTRSRPIEDALCPRSLRYSRWRTGRYFGRGRPELATHCSGPMGAIGTRLSLRPLRERETNSKTRATHVARMRKHDSQEAQQTQCRPGLDPGPITTNASCCAAPGHSPLQQQIPVVMGPCSRAQLRTGATTRHPQCPLPRAAGAAIARPTNSGGYGSRLSPARPTNCRHDRAENTLESRPINSKIPCPSPQAGPKSLQDP